ncbi:TPA: YjdF family protein [Staphylococcus aureus]
MELSIFYDGQFFVALVEYKMENKSKFIQYTFGNEPDDIEVLDFIHHQLVEMIDDVQTIVYTKNKSRKVNPKKLQRQIAKEQKKPKYSTQAQIAIKEELELKKKQRRKHYKEKRDAFQKRKREIKKVKAKEKHKGH